MKPTSNRRSAVHSIACSLGLLVACAATGCQVDVGGQTLPSPYYLDDDVQYFAPGPEFKLSREADALKQSREKAVLEGR